MSRLRVITEGVPQSPLVAVRRYTTEVTLQFPVFHPCKQEERSSFFLFSGSGRWDWLLRKQSLLRYAHPYRSPRGHFQSLKVSQTLLFYLYSRLQTSLHGYTNKKKSCKARLSNFGWKMGFEPTTFGTTIRHSNQLSYIHHIIRFRIGDKSNTDFCYIQICAPLF